MITGVENLVSGLIIKGIGGFYYIRVQDKVFECKARGKFRNNNKIPLPGDKVEISILDENKRIGSIEKILERTSLVVRPCVANVDTIIIVVSTNSPEPDYLLLDKLLVYAESMSIKPVICVNKTDLDYDNVLIKIKEIYVNTGYEIIGTSCFTNTGCAKLKKAIGKGIAIFSGISGSGKSTLINNIMESVVMETGALSKKLSRGKHTTRHAELIELDTGGFIADTPGFSSFKLDKIKADEIELFFPEFKKYLNCCKYTGCHHISEPECKIKEALENNKISQERYNRYVEFFEMLKDRKIAYKLKNKKRNEKYD